MNEIKQIYLIILMVSTVGGLTNGQTTGGDTYQKAISEFSQNHFEKAIELLNNDYVSVENDPMFTVLRGDSYFALNKFEKALSDYIKAYKLKNKEAALKIAECYSLLNEPQKSVEFLKEYLKTPDKLLRSEIKLLPAFTKIENTKAWINLWKEEHYNSYEKKTDEAKFLMNKEDYATALDISDKLIIKNKRRHRAYELRGDILMLNKDYKNAAISYLKASEIKKHNLSYKIKAADAFFYAKKYKQAEKMYGEIVENKYYNPLILLNDVKNEIQLKNYSEAAGKNNLLLRYYPNNAEAWYLSGLINSNKGENIQALEAFNNAVKIDNSQARYFIASGDAYLKTKTFESAVYSYSMALDLDPKLAEAWYKKGLAEIKLYKYSEACEDLKKAKSMNYNKADDLLFKYCK